MSETSIEVRGRGEVVVLSEPDVDGDYGWTCTCGVRLVDVQPIADAIEYAENHLNIWHEERA